MQEDSKKNIIKLVISLIVLLITLVGAAYAYFLAPSTNNSETSVITSTLEENGVVSLTNPVDSIHIEIQPRDMNESKKGTTYYGTVDPNKQYETEETYHEIAKATVTGGSDNTEYTCKFNLKTTISGTMKDKLKEGDMSITFSGAYTGTYDLTELTETREVTINLSGTNRSQSIYAKIEFNNRDAHQRYIAGHTLDIEINNESFSCGGSDIQRITTTEWVFDYTGGEQTFTAPYTGVYKIELWGASGRNGYQILANSYGFGAYTAGNIHINKNDKLYLYVGQGTSESTEVYASTRYYFNGGGFGEAPGGGVTDIRLINSDWDNTNGIMSRIMVSAGGGGAVHYRYMNMVQRGNAGGLLGYDALFQYTLSNNRTDLSGHGATQISGGNTGVCIGSSYCSANNPNGNGVFGKAGYYAQPNVGNRSSGGGGGYYGGGHGTHPGNSWAGGGGGSSFISGHNGCVAIESSTSLTPRLDSSGNRCANGTTDIECSKHYSGYVFTDTVMIDGAGYSWTTVKDSQVQMPKPDGTLYPLGQGHTGNGYAKITYIR